MNKTKSKALIIAVVATLLVSSLALTFSYATAFPVDLARGPGNRLTSASWIKLNGFITQWGETPVNGTIQTQARQATHAVSGTNQFAAATAMWTTNTTRAMQEVKAKENFTYVYYVARIANVSVSTVDAGSGSYFINGTWTVSTVNAQVTIITNDEGQIVRVLRDQDSSIQRAYGELSIADNKFNLTINGIDTLSGSVFRSIARAWNNPFKMCDDDATSGIVTRDDVKAVGRCYGAMPGWGNFDLSMDFNNNYRVDIADISTVAANVQ
jgi:hypothetical protein